jgi:thiamine-monophosphate kinase
MSKADFTPVSDLSRNKVIKNIQAIVSKSEPNMARIVRGIGDDCAVVRVDGQPFLRLSTSETYVEGVDFDLTYSPLQHVGYKLVSAAISDIYAMNGTPESMLVNVALPNKISSEMINLLFEGVGKAAQTYDCPMVGGDITASAAGLVVSISINGIVHEESITYRSGAAVNDALCVTGDLGGAFAGLKILLREKKFWLDNGSESSFQPDLKDYEYVVRRQLVPESRNDIISTFAQLNIVPSAMIDISKNLLQDTMQLIHSSGVGVKLYSGAIPIALETRAVADEFEEDVDQYALQGGEDYELLFTLSEKDVNLLMKHFKDVVVIGKILPKSKGMQMQTASGDTMHFDTSQME